MLEEWRDIPGYEGRYQVSDLGRVRSVDHYVRCGREGKGRRLVKGRVLRPGRMDRFNHVSVALGKGNSLGVHVLVALAFIGPRPSKLDVCHWNGIGDDNRWSNLIYETRAENNRHAISNGRCKVSLEDVQELRRCSSYTEAKALGDVIGISASYAYNIMRGRNFAYLDV